jgi:hypothetical protein
MSLTTPDKKPRLSVTVSRELHQAIEDRKGIASTSAFVEHTMRKALHLKGRDQ